MLDIHTSQTSTLRAAGATHVGLKRSGNQDTFICESIAASGLYVVIDGVGGYAGGDVAAAIARERILARVRTRAAAPADLLRQAVADANAAILERRNADPALAQMSCVLTAAIASPRLGRVYAAHVGDTRLYRYSGGGLKKLTRDHSFVGLREDAGQLTEEEAMRHPRRNEILRDVGSAPRAAGDADFIESVESVFLPGDALLLCSDGLTDLVPLAVMTDLLASRAGDARGAVKVLTEAALENGGSDNVTVIVAEYPAPQSGDGTAAIPPAATDDTTAEIPPLAVPTPQASAAPEAPPSQGPLAGSHAGPAPGAARTHEVLAAQPAARPPMGAPPAAGPPHTYGAPPEAAPPWGKRVALGLVAAALVGAAVLAAIRFLGGAEGAPDAPAVTVAGPPEAAGQDLAAALAARVGAQVSLEGARWRLDSTATVAAPLLLDGGGAEIAVASGAVAFDVPEGVARVEIRDVSVDLPVGAGGLVRVASPRTRVVLERVTLRMGGASPLAGEGVAPVVVAADRPVSLTLDARPTLAPGASGAAPAGPAPGASPGVGAPEAQRRAPLTAPGDPAAEPLGAPRPRQRP